MRLIGATKRKPLNKLCSLHTHLAVVKGKCKQSIKSSMLKAHTHTCQHTHTHTRDGLLYKRHLHSKKDLRMVWVFQEMLQ